MQELSTESAHPSVDVISEFNVITNPYSAEYGRGPGAVVSVNTRSGSNQVHGTAYEYVRNQYFDAFDYFTKRTTTRKAEDNQNQFGASLGGPIKRDRLFFFFNYEGTRIKQGLSRISTVPLDNERDRRFQQCGGCRGRASELPHGLRPHHLSHALHHQHGLPGIRQQSDPGRAYRLVGRRLDAALSRAQLQARLGDLPELNNYREPERRSTTTTATTAGAIGHLLPRTRSLRVTTISIAHAIHSRVLWRSG